MRQFLAEIFKKSAQDLGIQNPTEDSVPASKTVQIFVSVPGLATLFQPCSYTG